MAAAVQVCGVIAAVIAVMILAPAAYLTARVRQSKVALSLRATIAATARLSMGQIIAFTVWIIQLLSVLLQGARYLPGAMPLLLRAPLLYLQPLLFELPTIHPTCLGESPVQRQVVVLSLSTATCLVFYACAVVQRVALRADGWQHKAQLLSLRMGKLTHLALVLLYPLVAINAVESLDCMSKSDGAGPTSANNAGTVHMVWRPNVYVMCFEGVHMPAMALASVALLLHTVA